MKVSIPKTVYKKLVDHMNEAVWVGDKSERTLYVNKKFRELTGYPLKDVLGKKSFDFFDKETAGKIKNANLTKRKEGKSSSYEGNLLSKSGKKIPVLLSGAPLDDGGTIGLITDLRELKNKESMYQRLVEHMNEAVWVGDKDECTVYANPKFCEVMGYTLDEMMGRKSYDFWTKESANKVKNVNLSKRKKGMSSSYEGELLTKDGETVPVLLSGTPLPGGGTTGIMTDLRELKKKEEKERILNKAIQYSTDAVIVFNKKGKIKSWNKGAKIVFGYKKDEIVGSRLDKVFLREDVKSMLNHSEVMYNFELKGKHKNKKEITTSVTLSPIFAEDDRKTVLSYLLIARDITNQVKFEEDLALKYKKMTEAFNKFGVIRRQMDYVFELLDVFKESTDKKNVADFVVSSIIMLTRVDACVLRLYNKKKDSLDLVSCFGLASDWEGKSSIKYDNSLAEKAFEQGSSLKIIDITKEPKYQSKYLANKNSLCSLLLIPLSFGSDLIGSLSLYVTLDKKLEIFENEFIEKYANLIAVILSHDTYK